MEWGKLKVLSREFRPFFSLPGNEAAVVERGANAISLGLGKKVDYVTLSSWSINKDFLISWWHDCGRW